MVGLVSCLPFGNVQQHELLRRSLMNVLRKKNTRGKQKRNHRVHGSPSIELSPRGSEFLRYYQAAFLSIRRFDWLEHMAYQVCSTGSPL